MFVTLLYFVNWIIKLQNFSIHNEAEVQNQNKCYERLYFKLGGLFGLQEYTVHIVFIPNQLWLNLTVSLLTPKPNYILFQLHSRSNSDTGGSVTTSRAVKWEPPQMVVVSAYPRDYKCIQKILACIFFKKACSFPGCMESKEQ